MVAVESLQSGETFCSISVGCSFIYWCPALLHPLHFHS